MEKEEIRLVVKEAVHETLHGLGMSASEPLEMQADLVYLRKMRKGSEYVNKRLKATVISVLVPTFLFMLWEAFKVGVRN